MSEPECARFLERLDLGEEETLRDPHALSCAMCAAALSAAARMRRAMADRGPAPPDFAARVAYLAWADAQERRRVPGGWPLRGTTVAGPIAAAALGIGFAFAMPLLLDVGANLSRSLPPIGELPVAALQLASIGLVGTAFLTLASVRLARRRV